MSKPDIEEGSASSASSQVVEELVGTTNEYLVRLLERVVDDKLIPRPVIDKFKDIAVQLEAEMKTSKNKNDLPSLLINTLLREKVSDRSSAEASQRQKTILLILTIVLPILTNVAQFIMTYYLGLKPDMGSQ